MTELGLSEVLTLLVDFGTTAIFLWLFVREQRLHEETRRIYTADLREIAGLRFWGTKIEPKTEITVA